MDKQLSVAVDRIEGGFVVLEGLGPVPRELLPAGLAEGDHLTLMVGPSRVVVEIDPSGPRRASQEIEALRGQLVPMELGEVTEL